ncbi:MAG: hypothetical protein HYW85_05645 [Deltaproteobacteria bacterium]|nr:hypothetical protein [Deltaproteobacteria bacterium]
MIKKFVFLSLFSIFLLTHSIGQAAASSPFVYKTIKLININFDDHLKALDFFIAKWKPKKNPTPSSFYEEPAGLDGGGGRDIVYENAKYISQLILASWRPLDGLRICHENKEESLDELDTKAIADALSAFEGAYTLMREYSIRVYNIRQDFQDLTDLHATRAKIIEGKAKLQEILSRGPQKKN